MRVAVLITCHNRVAKTLKCLEAVFHNKLPASLRIEVYLVDDCSVDGTAESVCSTFPEVHLFKGDGELFWNRGMVMAWEAAAKDKPDFYLWLNDDTTLHPNALSELYESSARKQYQAIVVGATSASADSAKVTYGGRNESGVLVRPNGDLQACKFFNGNCVLIPDAVFQKLGTLDPYYRHSFGDFDYGYRAAKAGVEVFVAPSILGTCDVHTSTPKWRNPKFDLFTRMKFFYSPLGCNPFEVFHLDRVRSNVIVGVMHFVSTHVRVLFPGLWGREKA